MEDCGPRPASQQGWRLSGYDSDDYLPQAEGVLGDLLVVRNMVKPKGNKLFLVSSRRSQLEENEKKKEILAA